MEATPSEDILIYGNGETAEKCVETSSPPKGIDIEDIITTDKDLTFQQSRLVVKDFLPRCTSYSNLVDIELSFASENAPSNILTEEIHENPNAEIHETTDATSEEEHTKGQIGNDEENASETCSDLDDSQTFDCGKFLLLFKILSTQYTNEVTSACKISLKNANIVENVSITRKENFSEEFIRLHEQLAKWVKRFKKKNGNINPSEWGIELSNMAGQTITIEEKELDFETFKKADTWNVFSQYIQSMIRGAFK